MTRTFYLLNSVLYCCGIVLLAGCKITPSAPPVTLPVTPPVTSGGTTPPGGPSVGESLPASIYAVVSGIAEDKNWSSDSVFIFAKTTTSYLNDEVASWEIAGSKIRTDSAGNLYVLTDKDISVIPPYTPLLTKLRSLPVGPGTKIPTVNDMAVSLTGEIFISDGKGIAVFDETANGTADPARYILGNSQPGGGPATAIAPGLIAVDPSGNLYVQNTADSSIAVFGPTATGTVVPSRKIAGPQAQLNSDGQIDGVATDTAGDLYVLCNCVAADNGKPILGIIEFDPAANGNVSPIRSVTTAGMNSNYSGTGVAVDSAGTIYISGGKDSNTTIFEFSATASGNVAPANTVTLLYGGSLTGIAVH
jgi:hypothetical protein